MALTAFPKVWFSASPSICDAGSYRIVQGLDLSDEFSQNRIAATLAELEEERSAIQDLL